MEEDFCPACKFIDLYNHIRELEAAIGERSEALQAAGGDTTTDVSIDSMVRDREDTIQEYLDLGKYMADHLHWSKEMAKNAMLN